MNPRVLLFAAALLSLCNQAVANYCHEVGLTTLGIEFRGAINNQEFPATLTTSNVRAAITSRLAEELNLAIESNPSIRTIPALGQEGTYRYVRDLDVEVFGSQTQLKNVAVWESERQFMAISMLAFHDLIIRLNFPESEVCFYPRTAFDLKNAQNMSIDTDPEFDAPVVRVRMNEKIDAWLAIQPGYSGGVLLETFLANRLNLGASTDADTNERTYSGVLDSLEFGPYELTKVAVEFPREGTPDNLTTRESEKTGTKIQSERGFRGNIGMGVLKHFVLTLDLRTERLHVYAPPPPS